MCPSLSCDKKEWCYDLNPCLQPLPKGDIAVTRLNMHMYPTALMLGGGRQNIYWIWRRMANEKAKCEASAHLCI